MAQSELVQAVNQICEEKGISLESVIETIEAALAAAYRKDFGDRIQNIRVNFDLETGGFRVFDVKTVVTDEMAIEAEEEKKITEGSAEEGQEPPGPPQPPLSKGGIVEASTDDEQKSSEAVEEKPRYNPKTMIPLAMARMDSPDIELDAEWKKELTVSAAFGRMAAQTAKQVIIQKLREAERDMQYQQFKGKEGMVLNAMIQRSEGRLVLVDLGSATAILPPPEQIKTERYRVGERVKVLLKSVVKGPKGPEITVSRTAPEIVQKLFELEVPEIAAGTVEIKSVAREAGSRSKIAVVAHEANIDPIGSCVGQRGTRVQTVISELGGEKIDIIEYSDNAQKFIANALAPAKVIRAELNEAEARAIAYVNEDQLSLAIGRGGQNVRLAAGLTGWRIDIAQEGGGVVKQPVEEVASVEQQQIEEQGADIMVEDSKNG